VAFVLRLILSYVVRKELLGMPHVESAVGELKVPGTFFDELCLMEGSPSTALRMKKIREKGKGLAIDYLQLIIDYCFMSFVFFVVDQTMDN